MITQKELKELLHYDPITGIFTWLVNRRGTAKKGSIAGYLRKEGYNKIKINSKQYFAHRLAWLYETGSWPIKQIDHRNGIKNCNIWNNLREANNSQNQMNSIKYKNCSSGFKGVHWVKRDKKWHAQIQINKKKHHLGYYNTPEEAHEAYCKASKNLHKEFSNIG